VPEWAALIARIDALEGKTTDAIRIRNTPPTKTRKKIRK
jgi:hypothetical protein